jgi:hypothetical protein
VYNKEEVSPQVERSSTMTRRQPGYIRLIHILFAVTATLMGVILVLTPYKVQAEGNEPTTTPTATITLMPSETPVPTETPQEDVLPNQSDKSVDENVAPLLPADEQPSPTEGGLFQGTNMCLIGGIVLGAIVVMVMVVFGVIQRIRANP